ncbi:MAG: glycosyltransferase family A protein [bacterium]
MISIIIPIYNQADKLDKCLDSILIQTCKDYEIIIVNDGSTDNVDLVIKNYENMFDKFKIISQSNQGSNPARNRGAQDAKGEFLLFCDADLVMQPNMLEDMIQALKNNLKASYAYSSFKYGVKLFKLWPFNPDKLRQMPYIHTSSLIRKEHFPGFDNNIKRLQDWDLWLTMLENDYIGVWIDKILFKTYAGGMISSWIPKIFYNIPFLPLVKKYRESVNIIKQKHNL